MRVTRTLRATVGAALTGALLITASGTASADQTRKDLWPLEAFGAEQLWKEATGKGVTVAVLDTGFRQTHQDLKGQFLPGPDFGKATQEEGAQDLKPGESVLDHGTGMAAIIAGHGHGPGAPRASRGWRPTPRSFPCRSTRTLGWPLAGQRTMALTSSICPTPRVVRRTPANPSTTPFQRAPWW